MFASILAPGEKIHVIHRRHFDHEPHHHFVGVVNDYREGVLRMTGNVYAVDTTTYRKAGSFYKYNGEVLAQGREATKTYLIENPSFMKKVQKEIWDAIKKGYQDTNNLLELLDTTLANQDFDIINNTQP